MSFAVVSTIPFDGLFKAIAIMSGEGGGGSPFGNSNRLLKVLRLVRLIKLLRIAKVTDGALLCPDS